MPEMRLPGPDHPITITAHDARVQVSYQGHVIGDSREALRLKESSYKSVLYFPREDIDMAFLARTDRVTYCPYKGEANYFSLFMDGRLAENAVWTYENPYPAMEEIRGRVAFYPHYVEMHEVSGGEGAAVVREAILHTDDGAGASQRDHWTPTAGDPPPP